MDDEQERHRIARLEAEADIRPHTGPCVECGNYRESLSPGRDGGYRVYCELCAIGTRTVSQRGKHP